ncbi:hypothetical protein P3W85_19420 [Cupriavidus basilensis]|uniref:Uncharacterized protein n=1 Tax=Cupriavidus basilensis TaxID=68895 RepID=A0ABT6AR91_9BURK|nr:hypothetical protein [Cupriavidus basilensis]MDF3835113.1 hypothetical protein [Cupriavidus basilensis]
MNFRIHVTRCFFPVMGGDPDFGLRHFADAMPMPECALIQGGGAVAGIAATARMIRAAVAARYVKEARGRAPVQNGCIPGTGFIWECRQPCAVHVGISSPDVL